MNLNAYTLIVTYLMAGLGLAAISLVESIGAAFTLAMAGATAFTLALNLKGRRIIPGAIWNPLAAVVFAFFIADYLAFSGSLIVAAGRFLTILLVLKLFDLARNRDFVIAYGIVFFQILSAAASTVSPIFLIILSLFIIGAIWAMILFNMKRDYQEAHPAEKGFPRVAFGGPFFAYVVGASAFSIVVTFIIFFIMPRMEFGFFQRKTLNTVKVSGFSDRVDLGTIGPVKEDPTIIMRVGINPIDKPDGLIYFRGMALDSYDGKGWSKTLKDEIVIRRNDGGVFNLTRLEGRAIEQSILLEPLDTDVLFAAGNPVSIEGPFQNIWFDRSGTIRLPSPPYSRIQYKARSILSPVRKDLSMPLLQYSDTSFLNEGPEGARIKALAESVTDGALGAREIAQAIEAHLKSSYSYTLNPNASAGLSPLDDFLFGSRQGYCEHYATAMAALLRAKGIPSRIVTGFLNGEWNGLGSYYIVRQQDAHSWVEAFIEHDGWVRFDPTPSAGVVSYSPSPVSLYMDLLRWRWNRYIIQFSFSDQRQIAMRFEGVGAGVFENLRNALLEKKTGGAASKFSPVAVVVVIVVGLIVWRLFTRKKTPSRTPRFYAEMLRTLKRRGLSRKPAETPLEFAERTGITEVKDITTALHIERYGGRRLTEAERGSVDAAMGRLKRSA
ncbi:MAG: hypothetical protein A2X93_08075 [Deltaproteobacteria bacterium GWC2_56_8]|nr:MAG: hypothetical protein A2X93_08075 [Deltaproteobacteria bacterium GWC2_56_8]